MWLIYLEGTYFGTYNGSQFKSCPDDPHRLRGKGTNSKNLSLIHCRWIAFERGGGAIGGVMNKYPTFFRKILISIQYRFFSKWGSWGRKSPKIRGKKTCKCWKNIENKSNLQIWGSTWSQIQDNSTHFTGSYMKLFLEPCCGGPARTCTLPVYSKYNKLHWLFHL